MPLMASPQSGEFVPYVKMNAKAGRFYTKDDEGNEYEVTDFTAAFDMDNIQTGWFLYAPGVAPQITLDPSITQAAERPSDKHKRGFVVNVFSDKNLGGVREFSSTAGAVIEAINEVYDAWEAGKASNLGKTPIVKCTGVQGITGKHGTNYRPKLEIVAWADRPAALADAPRAQSNSGGQAAATPAPAPAPAGHTPPPGAGAPASADVEF